MCHQTPWCVTIAGMMIAVYFLGYGLLGSPDWFLWCRVPAVVNYFPCQFCLKIAVEVKSLDHNMSQDYGLV